MLLSCWFLFALATARDISQPRLKPGHTPFVSRVVRSRANGNPRVVLALSSTTTVALDLEPDLDLLSPGYEEVEIAPNGQKTTVRKATDITVCWFKGSISGDPLSRVAVTDCDGYFSGLIKQGDGKHFVAKAIGNGNVAVYPSEDEEVVSGTCGAVSMPTRTSGRRLLREHQLSRFSGRLDAHEHHDPNERQDDGHKDERITVEQESDHHDKPGQVFSSQRSLLEFSATTDILELATVSDQSYLLTLGGSGTNVTTVGLRNIELVGLIRTIYETATFTRPTSVRLKAQYFFSTGDPYSLTEDTSGRVPALTLLETFTTWSKSELGSLKFDAVHLLTGRKFDSSTVGLAYVGVTCNSDYKTGLTSAWYGVTTAVNIMAHELGHNLGMNHDGLASTTACASSGFLMGPYIDSCPTSGICPISSCSITDKNAYTATANCLNSWTEPTCTDGLWNGLEEGVDCGGSLCVACPGSGPNPALGPSRAPTTARPSRAPTQLPTSRPTTKTPTRKPTRSPTSRKPTRTPTRKPSRPPTRIPTRKPTRLPTRRPTRKPSTQKPTRKPTPFPTRKPTL